MAMVVGAGLSVLGLAAVAWRGMQTWGALSRMQLRLRRSPGAPVAGAAGESVQPKVTTVEESGGKKTTTIETSRTVADGLDDETQTSPAGSTASPLAKEPVIVGSTLLAAGVLGIGFATNLDAEAIAAIAAGGGAAAVAALVRPQVTSLANPKSVENQPLKPVKSK